MKMNAPIDVKSRAHIERYVLKKLKEIYWEYPRKIYPDTPFKELERHSDSDLTDPGLLIYLEEDLGVELPDEEALRLDAQDVHALIDAILRHLTVAPRTSITAHPSHTETH
jgi:acyl carrier protein